MPQAYIHASTVRDDMRLLIGVMHTIENEFEECLRSMREQSHTDWDVFVVENLPNKLAHDTLFGTFMERAAGFDLFMKVDADMIIRNRDFFAETVDRFRRHPQIQQVNVKVFDYFSDRLIGGLATFRSSVRWKRHAQETFVDEGSSVPVDGALWADEPHGASVFHCANPSPFQAFHFGLHKGVKVREGRREGGHRRWQMIDHWENIELTWEHFQRSGDVRLGWASLGAELALRGTFEPDHVSYSNPHARQVFAQYERMDADAVRQTVSALRRPRAYFPWRWRLTVLGSGWLRWAWGVAVPAPLQRGIRSLRRAALGTGSSG